MAAACSNDEGTAEDAGDTGQEQEEQKPSAQLGGYAASDGLLILSTGTYTRENAFLSFVSADGTVEERAYAAANAGTELGNDGVGLYLCDGKQYILCNDWRKAEGKGNNGMLTIADAETLKKEKSFARKDMVFQHPINDELEEVDENLNGIAVLDEKNIFLIAQGVLRFDSTTGKLTLVEGAYAIGNAGYANTVESVVSSRGVMVVGDRLYGVTGGFWTGTALVEFVKGKDEVNRRLELGKGQLVSGICQTSDGTLLVATYSRGKDVGYLYFVDLESWSIVQEKTVNANISPGSSLNSGIVYLDDYIYFTGAEDTEFTADLNLTLSRYSLKTGRVEKNLADFKADEPNANLLDCCIMADPATGCIYVPTANERMEGVVPESYILVYDCNGEKPKLKSKISKVAHGVVGIYPLSMFDTSK